MSSVAHSNLAAHLGRLGRLDEALVHARTAVRLQPDYAFGHGNLANLLRLRGNLDEAFTHFQEAARLNPEYLEAHLGQGAICTARERWEDALGHYQQAVRVQPNHSVAHANLAATFGKLGRLDEAIEHCRAAIRLDPGQAPAHANLGNAFKLQGRLEEAVGAFRAALRLRPDDVAVLTDLGAVLAELGAVEEAVEQCRAALRLRPDHVAAHINLGNALKLQGQPAESLAAYQEALRLRPDCAEAHAGVGAVLAEQARPDEAAASCHQALRCEPDYATPYSLLCALAVQRQYRLTEDERARLTALLAGGTLKGDGQALLHYALAGLLDKEGAYDEAFAHYRAGNELRREQFALRGRVFDAARHQEQVERILAACSRKFFRQRRGFGVDSEVPVFIVGMPRSGTTLVEQILSSHPQVFGAGELRDLLDLAATLPQRLGVSEKYPACLLRLDRNGARILAEEHLQRLRRRGDAARIVDKEPFNFLHLGLIYMLFPRARIIHCRRAPLDTCLSCYVQDFKQLAFTLRLEDIGRYYRQYERLIAHWREIRPLPMYEVVYEELVANQEAVSRELVAFCGLEWDARCLAFHENQRAVLTASKLQVRRPMYRSSVRRWERYAAHLEPLRQALGMR